MEGLQNIPAQGGAIIAANHISLWDPPLLGTALERPIHFMAKEELFKNSLLRMIISALNAFPVKRGSADRNAIRNALSLLERGQLLGLFPEGTRSKTGELGKAEAGISMIALKANVPIIPTAIIGTNKVFSGTSWLPVFVIRFGPAIYPDANPEYRKNSATLGEKIMAEIAVQQANAANKS
ncbi:lysophospholipid acyltransferase family protein [Azotosporobacter soli]|uniref:lysophospholipid acyltransferase family protein n=1 Tax=Azotosporobacter soli TaxID=3055040 RepID=UPI0031FEA80A